MVWINLYKILENSNQSIAIGGEGGRREGFLGGTEKLGAGWSIFSLSGFSGCLQSHDNCYRLFYSLSSWIVLSPLPAILFYLFTYLTPTHLQAWVQTPAPSERCWMSWMHSPGHLEYLGSISETQQGQGSCFGEFGGLAFVTGVLWTFMDSMRNEGTFALRVYFRR